MIEAAPHLHEYDWQQHKRGLIPRNFSTHPTGCFAFAPPYPDSEIIPESEWADRLNEQQKNKASLLDMRDANYEILKSLDQNGYGLCWAFSSTKAMMYMIALMNEPLVRLSAYWVAGIVKGWSDQGGWGAESMAHLAKLGAPAESFCPKYNRSYDTAETRTNAALHLALTWWDCGDDPQRNQRIMVSEALRGNPGVVDLNVMSHSMCCAGLISLNPITFAYDNSWKGWNDPGKGLYLGKGDYALPDGLVVPRVVKASPLAA